MASTRNFQSARPSYNQDDPKVQLSFDGLRRNLDQINSAPFLDGTLITNVSLIGNVDYLLGHKLGRPISNIVVVKVDSVNQIIVRFTGLTVPSAAYDKNTAAWIRASATGVVTLWVS